MDQDGGSATIEGGKGLVALPVSVVDHETVCLISFLFSVYKNLG